MSKPAGDFHVLFRERSKRHGLACTHQREVIYEALVASREHPTPEEVYEAVRRRIPSISLGTVYKNIKTFLEAGMLTEVSLHHGSLRVDACLEPHSHLVCRVCRHIVDLPGVTAGPARVAAKLPKGFVLERHTVEFVGICASCAKKQTSELT
jgi:Fur family transcriptional regulator, peroxide stress response regulator